MHECPGETKSKQQNKEENKGRPKIKIKNMTGMHEDT